LAVLLGSMAVARAFDTSWVATGLPVSAMKLKQNLDEAQTRIATLESSRTCPDNPGAPTKFGFCIWHDDNGTRYSQDHAQAAATCAKKGARLCTFAEVSAAWHAGAEWCSFSWVADTPPPANGDVTAGYASYPIQTDQTGCHQIGVSFDLVPLTTRYDANCCR
jgi:hypothetical protein